MDSDPDDCERSYLFNLTLPVTGGGYWLRGYRLSALTSSLELRPRTDEQFRTQSGPPWVRFWRRRRALSRAEPELSVFSPPEVCFSIGLLASQWRQASNSNTVYLCCNFPQDYQDYREENLGFFFPLLSPR